MPCEQCGKHVVIPPNEMLLCDGRSCTRGYHLRCISPPLTEVPSGDWLCAYCIAAGDDRRGASGRLALRPAHLDCWVLAEPFRGRVAVLGALLETGAARSISTAEPRVLVDARAVVYLRLGRQIGRRTVWVAPLFLMYTMASSEILHIPLPPTTTLESQLEHRTG